jgi:hypothetical protein
MATGRLQRYGRGAMTAWVAKAPLTRGQALIVGLWLVQAGAVAWGSLPRFVWARGQVGTREWKE